MEEIITVARTVTHGKHTINVTLTATRAQLQASALILARLGMRMQEKQDSDKPEDSKS